MSAFVGIFVLTCVSGILTYFSIDKYPCAPPYIAMLRMFHYFIFFFNVFYLFLFDKYMDLLYFIIALFTYIHWYFFNNECILSFLENSHFIPNYELGSLRKDNKYIRVYFKNYTDIIMAFSGLASLATFIYVVVRQNMNDMSTALIISFVISYLTVISVWKSSI